MSVGMRSIADALGVSVATVSRALRNDPAVQPATRDSVLAAAERLGYHRNSYVGEFMSSIRRSQTHSFKGNMGLIWGNRLPERDSEQRVHQIQLGAREQAEALGFSLSEFDLATSKPETISRILTNRGINGVMIAMPSFTPREGDFPFDFADFSSVSIGWGLLQPRLHNVRFDYTHALRLAIEHATPEFGKGVAAIWPSLTNLRSDRAAEASFLVHHPAGIAKARELFLTVEDLSPDKTLRLFQKHGVSCLLVEASVELPDWLQDVIPRRQTVLFRRPSDEPCFGWIDTQNELLGRWAVDILSTKLAHHERGIPDYCQIVLVPPAWMPG